MDIDFGDYFGWELKMCQSDTDAPIWDHFMRESLCMGQNVHTGRMELAMGDAIVTPPPPLKMVGGIKSFIIAEELLLVNF